MEGLQSARRRPGYGAAGSMGESSMSICNACLPTFSMNSETEDIDDLFRDIDGCRLPKGRMAGKVEAVPEAIPLRCGIERIRLGLLAASICVGTSTIYGDRLRRLAVL